MVEFSKREDLERWLEDKPREWATVIAARAALRVASMLVGGLGPRRSRKRRRVVLLIFRGMAAPWAVAVWPGNYTKIIPALNEAARVTHDLTTGSLVNSAVRATAHASGAAVYTQNAAATAFAVATASASDFGEAIWSAVSADATALESPPPMGLRPVDLAIQVLWPVGIPKLADQNWSKLKQALIEAGEDWEVWTDWYEERLRGGPANESLELARVLIGDEIWLQGPKVVNAYIREIVEKHTAVPGVARWTQAKWADVDLLNGQESPDIPEQRRAAIEPTWSKGRLILPKKPVKLDLNRRKFTAALSGLRSELRDLVDDVAAEANIDKRPAQFLGRLAVRIPQTVPTHDELFRLGHVETILVGFAKTVDEEWPNFLAARYHALALQFDRTMRQSPLWREFKQNAAKETLSAEQVVDAPALAREATSALREAEAPEFVDAGIPNALERLINTLSAATAENDAAMAQIEESSELLAADLIESVNNILKPIAEVALEYCQEAAKGFKRKAKELGLKDGEKAFMWLRRLGMAGVAAGVGHFAGLSGYLAKYPEAFDWLNAVFRHLH